MRRLGIPIIGCMMVFSCTGQRPENIGIHNGRLADCPARPNCISSQTTDKAHAIAPFRYQGDKATAFIRLKNAIASFEKMTIVSENSTYLHIECTSSIMGFVDDVEFSFRKEKEIHVRSASRIGYSDFGVNRKRIEKIRKRFEMASHPVKK